MPRPQTKGFKRPERVTLTPENVGDEVPVKSMLKQLSASYIESLRESPNEAFHNLDNITVQLSKSNPAFAEPDRLTFKCSVTGAQIIRTAHGSSGVNV